MAIWIEEAGVAGAEIAVLVDASVVASGRRKYREHGVASNQNLANAAIPTSTPGAGGPTVSSLICPSAAGTHRRKVSVEP
jgi:hypothetical protein